MKRWYVVQVYAGFEQAVKDDLDRRMHEEGLQDFFGDVLVPSTKVKGMFDSEGPKEQQMFPGYILVEVEIKPESFRLVVASPRVLRFLGGKEPIPVPKKEVDRVVSQMKGEVVIASSTIEFEVGQEVEIKDGPFAGFVGIIDKVDLESEKLVVMVSIFGRMTPVELSFNQVAR